MSGAVWNATRWGALFFSAYHVNQQTDSPILVQLTGATFFAPMFIGGLLGGAIADRVDRLWLTLTTLVLLGVVGVVLAGASFAGHLETWMIYSFVFAAGIGGLVDFTARASLIFDIVGPMRSTNAFALELFSRYLGNTVGLVVGGATIQAFGESVALLGMGIATLVAFAILWPVHWLNVGRALCEPEPVSIGRDVRQMFGLLSSAPGLIGILAVTVLMNLFYFTLIPMVPVFADRLGANALFAGILAAAPGFGTILCTLTIAALAPRRRGLIYVGSSAVCLVLLFLFAASPWYALALLVIFVAGFCQGGFSTMQAVLAMSIVSAAARGRAMGLVSMAIGSVPVGMLTLGVSAEVFGVETAVMTSALLGAIAMVGLLLWRRDMVALS